MFISGINSCALFKFVSEKYRKGDSLNSYEQRLHKQKMLNNQQINHEC